MFTFFTKGNIKFNEVEQKKVCQIQTNHYGDFHSLITSPTFSMPLFYITFPFHTQVLSDIHPTQQQDIHNYQLSFFFNLRIFLSFNSFELKQTCNISFMFPFIQYPVTINILFFPTPDRTQAERCHYSHRYCQSSHESWPCNEVNLSILPRLSCSKEV